MMRAERKPKADRAAIILVSVVVLGLATTFALLYALTPPTVATVEPQYRLSKE